jgi:hypothetical protein
VVAACAGTATPTGLNEVLYYLYSSSQRWHPISPAGRRFRASALVSGRKNHEVYTFLCIHVHLFLVFAFRDARFLSGLYHRFSYNVSLHLLGWMAVPRAAYDAIVAKISNSNSDERKSALLALALVWIAARHFSPPVTSLLAARWARVRAALLRIALRIVRALGVGAVRVTMAASAAEPQLVGALA